RHAQVECRSEGGGDRGPSPICDPHPDHEQPGFRYPGASDPQVLARIRGLALPDRLVVAAGRVVFTAGPPPRRSARGPRRAGAAERGAPRKAGAGVASPFPWRAEHTTDTQNMCESDHLLVSEPVSTRIPSALPLEAILFSI